MCAKNGETMIELTVVGIDIGKDTFHLVGFNSEGRRVLRRKIKRLALNPTFEDLPRCVVGMEACLSAHFVSRTLRALGFEPRIIPAIYVKPFNKGQKNDYNDAEAIAEAALRPNLRPVSEKSQDQLDLQALQAAGRSLVPLHPAVVYDGTTLGRRPMTKRAPRPSVLLNWIGIDRRSDLALYRQIGKQIRDAILDGDIEPGAYVPASRALAADLGVSRITTLQAYEQLISERFLESKRGSGTRIAAALAEQPLPKRADAHEPFQAPHLQEFYDVEPQNVEFQPGIPAFDAFPRGRWSRLLQRHGARNDQHLLDYAHIGGYAPLRQEIANYLNGSRGVTCSPEQVIVVASTRAAVGAVCSVLWRHGSEVMVEDPGYRVIQRVLIAAGMRLRHVPVDAKGIRTDQLSRVARDCVGAYLTPAQQWPTGRTLVAERRVSLLDWAKRTGAWIVEDDYDSEFRFDSPPVAPLHSFGSGRVVLVGTFSKTLVPSLRTAYMVVPADMVTQFERAVFQNGSEPPLHVQAALAEFLAEGDYTRHIARMRKLYARRRARLVQALEEVFGGVLAVTCPPGGLQVIAQLPEGVAAEEITRRAAGIGIVARPMSVYHANVEPPNALHLGFAAVPEDRIEPGVVRLHSATADLF